jgi:Arabinogalactan endo-1,4-beta-galactosidase
LTTTNGQPIDDVYTFYADQGVNLVRLRLWVNPVSGKNNLTYVKAQARRIKQSGMHWLLCMHYSDTWADPGRQTTPIDWQNLTMSQLEDQVAQYTVDVLQAFLDQQTPPAIIQIGNETQPGYALATG